MKMLHILANSVTNLPHTHYKYMKELNILAKTAIAEFPKTLLNIGSCTGELGSADVLSAAQIISKENKEANIPATTTSLARFLPYISLIKSVIRKVIG